MKITSFFPFTLLLILTSCSSFVPKYGINPTSSEIGLTKSQSPERYNKVIDSMALVLGGEYLDKEWRKMYSYLDTSYFHSGDVLYFKDEPREFVLVNYYFIWAVYSPSICEECADNTLNGLSPQLDSISKIRIEKRVQSLFK
jgi:hypothetical protein